MKRLVCALVVFGVTGLGGVAAAARSQGDDAGGPTGVHLTPLSDATITGRVHATGAGARLDTKGSEQVLVTAITVDPGGSFGWHSHPGPVLVTVSKGTLALYHAEHRHCMRMPFSAGQGFVETGGMVHVARNETDSPVELNATFLARPGTKDFLIPEAQPAACAGIR
jgi:quercetin dioxygenase-like cupin family protein